MRSHTSHDSGELSDVGSSSLSYYTDVASNASYGEFKQTTSSYSNRSSDSNYNRTSSPPVPALAKKLANTDPHIHFMADFDNHDDNLQTYPSPSNKKLNPRRKLNVHDEVAAQVPKANSEDTSESSPSLDNDDVMVVGHKMLKKLELSPTFAANSSTNGSDSRRNSVQQVIIVSTKIIVTILIML